MSENICAGTQMWEVGALDKLEFIVLLTSESLLRVNVKNVLGLNAGFCEDPRVTHWVTGIPNGESDSRSVLEVFPEKLMTFLYVQYHILVGRTYLIVHFPAPINYLEWASLYKTLSPTLVVIILTHIPVAEVFSLIVSERPGWILPQGVHDVLKNVW